MLYFDHCATTPPYPEVTRAVGEAMTRYFGNAASIHRVGLEAERLLGSAREQTARLLRVKPAEVFFTSGGTESNNLAVKGIAYQYRSRGRHLITTAVEHPSVYEAHKQLEAEGFRVTYLPVDSEGSVRPEDLERALADDTISVSVMFVNNETGAVQPIAEIGSILRRRRSPKPAFHVDAVQAVGKIPFEPKALGIDLMSVAAHKLRGPKGIGLLYRREGLSLYPLLAGGGQEEGVRPGTSSVPLIAGMAKALRMTMDSMPEHNRRLASLRERLLGRLAAIPGLLYNGSPDASRMAPHVVNVSLPGCKPEVIVHALEERDIFVSTKSACASGEAEPSRVLLAMSGDRERASSGIRISMSAEHTEADIDRLADALKDVCSRLVST